MTFKKDYINYVLYSVLNGREEFRENKRLKDLVERILAVDDVVKITYLIGKTAGLDLFFKYMLYLSDKIDKSQITIFNVRDNFDYDVNNLSKLFEKFEGYKNGNEQRKTEKAFSLNEIEAESGKNNNYRSKENMKIDANEPDVIIKNEEQQDSLPDDISEEEGPSGLTLIENSGSGDKEAEVFELSEINDDIETAGSDETAETNAEIENTAGKLSDDADTGEDEDSGEIITDKKTDEEEVFELDELEIEIDGRSDNKLDGDCPVENEDAEIEIEVRQSNREYGESDDSVKEESITNEAYYAFETKFFEEVKILEKLFTTVEKESKTAQNDKLGEKCLQSLSAIIEITSELSNLSRQLSFDLIADIFLTMNIYFTKSINIPELITDERIRLLDSSLALVNSLIKGEDYLNYDVIVDKIELLKIELQKPHETNPEPAKQITEPEPVKDSETEANESAPADYQEELILDEENYDSPSAKHEYKVKQAEMESVNFKLRYLIKEFEKSFLSIQNMKGEYKRFDALEKIDELNNALRLIAKITAGVKMKDELKLAEVTYVFLKYLKDYRMDFMDPEIQQILKYIIFTFKMLLTSRKPEDFSVLVQYLNNPVKIFADS